MTSLEAHALALGRISIQSGLGEPLRAEVDVSDMDAQESASLKAGVATPEAFRAAGLEYSTALTGLEISLQRRSDGRSYLRLSSNRAVTEPFVDLILEARWSSGRITRDYTLLLDPPKPRNAGTAANASAAAELTPTAPMLSPALPAEDRLPERSTRATKTPERPDKPEKAAKSPAQAAPVERMPSGGQKVTVKAGDNASRIAARYKRADVSLEQMLVALLKSNPQAFIDGNVNVIKSGAVLTLPEAQTAQFVSTGEAAQAITAQSKDFNAFRQKLAKGMPAAQVAEADRQAGGKLQARVEDRAPASQAPDKLTLSKGAVQGKAAADEKLAREQEAKDDANRLAELSKNISDLNQSGLTPTLPATAAAGTPGAAPSLAASAATALSGVSIVPPMVTASAAEPAAPAGVAAPADGASATAAPAPATAKNPAVVIAPEPERGLLDQLLDNSLVLGGGALAALLALFGFSRYRSNKNKKPIHADSSFLDSRLQPDSFFGASGGRRVDTSEGGGSTAHSSMAYTPSQLDTGGDVDPVAEADVYLAYGRDQQAEEILHEAMLNHPTRLTIHAKLLEIYAKRRDSKKFESVALTVFKQTKGRGAEWTKIAQMGRELTPNSSLYQTDAAAASTADSVAPVGAASGFTQTARAPLQALPASAAKVSLKNLDLDFSLDDAVTPAPSSSASVAKPVSPVTLTAPNLAALDLDFDLDLDASPYAAAAAPLPMTAPSPFASPDAAAATTAAYGINLQDDNSLDFTQEPFIAAPASAKAPAAHSGMLEFDMDSFTLDLEPTTQPPSAQEIAKQAAEPAEPEEDPLEIKFLLAEEFRQLGDSDGARSLAGEVLGKAKGPLKAKAQAFLNTLS
ncbi:MAG: FimV/HubP family polar landmark protein [Polaromonas sp.]